MSLKLSLRPHEKVIIGGAVVSAGNKHVELLIENVVPIMRQKDIMLEENANTPARRVYFAIQLMYIDVEKRSAHIESFFELAREIMVAAPSVGQYFQQMYDQVAAGQFYHALKTANQLIAYEKELTSNV